MPASRDPVSLFTLLGGAALLTANKGLLRLGLRKPLDGWRRAAGVVLRGEESTFVLSAFGLNAGTHDATTPLEVERRISSRLDALLQSDGLGRMHVRRGRWADLAIQRESRGYTVSVQSSPPGRARFVPPGEWGRAVPGEFVPLMNWIFRVQHDGSCDVWVRVNHVGIDGVPVQELLNRLESIWGVRGPVAFPMPQADPAVETAQAIPGRPGISMVQAFINFQKLLAWRKAQNAAISSPLTFAAALQWCLAQQPEFSDVHFGSTVEVQPLAGVGRGVGVVVVRPQDYVGKPGGLAAFANEFNRGIQACRDRTDDGLRTLDAAAHLPAHVARGLLRHALRTNPRAFGSMGMTVLKDAKVFGAPIAECGHERGFMAVGSTSLRSEDGGDVGCVTIKGPIERIGAYPAAIRRAISHCEV